MSEHDSDFLVRLLSQSLGPHAARERVGAVVRAKKLDPARLTQADAQAVLEQLTLEKGLVGTVARFAMARLALSWDRT